MPVPTPDISNDNTADGQGVGEVFAVFLRLGLTSFGGPIAHLGYFHREFVERRAWVNDSQYAQLLALCQFLPGPASSQLGFSIGLLRGGWPGALAAFVAFTLPSALLLFLFARIAPALTGTAGQAVIHGLKLVALVVVAHGVVSMAGRLCPDTRRRTIASGAAALSVIVGGTVVQMLVIVLGAVSGCLLLRETGQSPDIRLAVGYGRRTGWVLLSLFLVLLAGLPIVRGDGQGLLLIGEAFYRAGALVFGGGHVVLPLLEEAVVAPGWLTRSDFMTGYGAAQAIPGPMFTLSAYLGAHLPGSMGGMTGAVVALVAIFLPGFLLVASALPLWHTLIGQPVATRMIAGINAAVVGILAAALYDPVWTSAVEGGGDVVVALVGFLMLSFWRLSALIVVLWCLFVSLLTALF